jgi:hypothetical protein
VVGERIRTRPLTLNRDRSGETGLKVKSKNEKEVAIRIGVQVFDEIRIWKVPEETDIQEVLEMAREELSNELQEFRSAYKTNLTPVSDVETERKTLLR